MVRVMILLGLLLSACSSGGDSGFSESQRIVQGREVYAVAVNPALNDKAIAAGAKSLCKVGVDWCMVVVVPKGTSLPSGFPLSDAEAPTALGFYTLNRATGMDEFERVSGAKP